MAEALIGGRSVVTPRGPEAYPGLLVVRPSPEWPWIIVPEDGQTIEARGGETLSAYETAGGHAAQGFLLRPGDRARIVRGDLPASMVEWSLERAAPGA